MCKQKSWVTVEYIFTWETINKIFCQTRHKWPKTNYSQLLRRNKIEGSSLFYIVFDIRCWSALSAIWRRSARRLTLRIWWRLSRRSRPCTGTVSTWCTVSPSLWAVLRSPAQFGLCWRSALGIQALQHTPPLSYLAPSLPWHLNISETKSNPSLALHQAHLRTAGHLRDSC